MTRRPRAVSPDRPDLPDRPDHVAAQAGVRRRPVATRRALLLAAPALLLSRPSRALELAPTPRQSAGPFYPRTAPAEADADLTRYRGGAAPGEPMEMVGRVFDAKTAAPAAGAIVEIWHCDPTGVYAHVGFETDPHFQGYGAVRVGADGAYRFRTTRPGLYPGRARHIHVQISRGPGAPIALTTQMYFSGDPGNARDVLLRRAARPEALIARLEDGAPPRHVFDIALA